MKKPNYSDKKSKCEDSLAKDEEKHELNSISNDLNKSLINSNENDILEGLFKHLDSVDKHIEKNSDYDTIIFTEMLEYLYPRLSLYKENIKSTISVNNDLISNIKLLSDANFSFKPNYNITNNSNEEKLSLLKNNLVQNIDMMNQAISDYIGIYTNILNKKKIKERVLLISNENNLLKNQVVELYNKNQLNSIKDPIFEEISLLNIKNSINFLKNCSNENDFNFKSLEKDYACNKKLFNNKDSEILLNIVLIQVCGIAPIECFSRRESSLSLRESNNTVSLEIENSNNINNNNIKKNDFSDLFCKSIYFGVAFKLLHTTNVYLVQPNLNLYLESIGYSEYDSGYIIAIMHVAKLLSCFCYSYWTNSSFIIPYYFAALCMISANILYVTSYFFEANYLSFYSIIFSRIFIGLGSAKILHKRMSIDFSTYYNLFYFALILTIVNNLGHSLGPLINLLLSILLKDNNKLNFVFSSILFLFIWIGVLLYIKYWFKDPYQIKRQIEDSLNSRNLIKVYKDENIKLEDQIVAIQYEETLRPTIICSFKMHHFVLISIFTILKGVLEFQLWIIPILMGNIFEISTIGYTYYTITITLLCKYIFIKNI
jgi:hypothetical protein